MPIEWSEFALELVAPLETATGPIRRRRGIAIKRAEDGPIGVGEATPLPGWTESFAACREALRSADGTVAPVDSVALPASPAARMALTTATADRRARTENEPLYRSLGQDAQVSTIPVQRAIGTMDREATLEAAVAAVAAGFTTLKVKVGADELSADLDRITAIRSAVGSDVDLRLDANGAWDRETLDRFLATDLATDIDFLEQPLPAADREGYLAIDGPTQIAIDETCASLTVADLKGLLESIDVVVLKPMALGGPDRTIELAELARAADARVVVTTTIDGVIARTAAVHLAARLAPQEVHGLATASMLVTDIGDDPAPVENGVIRVPNEPGLGTDGPWGSAG